MIRKSSIPMLVVLVLAAGSWYPARSAEFRCWNGALERRIELSGPDTQGTACEVRYWRDASAPGSGRVLWRAQQDPDFCAAKARELVTRLEAGGWTCGPGEQPTSPEPTQAQAADLPPVAAAPAQAAPAAVVRDEPAATEPAAPSAVRADTEASFPDAPIVPPSGHPAAPLLDQVLRQTLDSVEQLYGGEFQAEHAAFGDLDGDGVQDAAVLITYEAARNDYVQYLVAYRFNGETFQSVATKNVGGRFLDALRAALRGIDDGRILVERTGMPRAAPRAGPRSFWTAASWSNSPMRAGPIPGRPARPDRHRAADRRRRPALCTRPPEGAAATLESTTSDTATLTQPHDRASLAGKRHGVSSWRGTVHASGWQG